MLADRIPHHSPVGRWLRWPLRFVGHGTRTIVSGAAAGLRWHVDSAPHGVWLGLYERRILRAFARELRHGAVVWDVGAHAGLYALVAARAGADVFAFEPLATNVQWIERNASVNGLGERVRIQPFALGATNGTAGFEADASRMEGRLSAASPTTVDVRRADDLDVPAPHIVKIDVEGAELDVLDGAARIIASARPTVFLEIHEPISIHDGLARLPGYRAEPLDAGRFVCRPAPRPND